MYFAGSSGVKETTSVTEFADSFSWCGDYFPRHCRRYYMAKTIDVLWSILNKNFTCRRDTSCGFHIHIFTSTGMYSLPKLRLMAKAVIYREPATARCAPPSRSDFYSDFCRTNLQGEAKSPPHKLGPLRGLRSTFDIIESSTRETPLKS